MQKNFKWEKIALHRHFEIVFLILVLVAYLWPLAFKFLFFCFILVKNLKAIHKDNMNRVDNNLWNLYVVLYIKFQSKSDCFTGEGC